MGYYTKVKKDFSFRKIKFKGIDCYEGDGTSIQVTVTGTAQMIRQILKSEYPKYNAQGTWVQTRQFANGNAIDVYLNRFPQDVYKAIESDLKIFDSYPVNHLNAKRIEIKTDDGLPIDANTKYLHVENVPPYGSKEAKESAPDWEKILKESSEQKTTNIPNKTTINIKGELLKECGGWKIYKKTLNDGRIVYNAIKDKETPPNKGDWNAIKGEVYVQSGFKWGKFGAFEKWGKMTPNDENLIFELLCSVLSKYYVKDEKQAPAPQMPNNNRIPSSTSNRIPSTDPSTWDATFKIGDKVKVRIDFDQIMKQGGFSVDDIFEITSKVYERDMVRPENPSGTLYNLNNRQSWEGKDLELAITGESEESPSFTKEEIEKTIKGLQYLADSGDADAIATINGLKYLI